MNEKKLWPTNNEEVLWNNQIGHYEIDLWKQPVYVQFPLQIVSVLSINVSFVKEFNNGFWQQFERQIDL